MRKIARPVVEGKSGPRERSNYGNEKPRSKDVEGVAFGGVRLEIFRCSSPFSGRGEG